MKRIVPMLLLLIVAGCTGRLKEKFVDFKGDVWSLDQQPEISVDEPEGRYEVYLYLEVSDKYDYSNIWLSLKMSDPDGGKIIDGRFNLPLATPEGRWMGESTGKGNGNFFLISREVDLKKAGKYTFQFHQQMRDDDLRGVRKVGVKLKRVSR